MDIRWVRPRGKGRVYLCAEDVEKWARGNANKCATAAQERSLDAFADEVRDFELDIIRNPD